MLAESSCCRIKLAAEDGGGMTTGIDGRAGMGRRSVAQWALMTWEVEGGGVVVGADGGELKGRRLSARKRWRPGPEPGWPTVAASPARATAALPRQSKRATPRCGVLATHPLQHASIARLSQGDRGYSILRGSGVRASASEYSCLRWASLDALDRARNASCRRCLRRCDADGGSGGGAGRRGHSVPAPTGGRDPAGRPERCAGAARATPDGNSDLQGSARAVWVPHDSGGGEWTQWTSGRRRRVSPVHE